MKQEWIKDYLNNVGREVNPAGSNSYSRNLTEALKFAFKNLEKEENKDKKPLLFLLLHQNY